MADNVEKDTTTLPFFNDVKCDCDYCGQIISRSSITVCHVCANTICREKCGEYFDTYNGKYLKFLKLNNDISDDIGDEVGVCYKCYNSWISEILEKRPELKKSTSQSSSKWYHFSFLGNNSDSDYIEVEEKEISYQEEVKEKKISCQEDDHDQFHADESICTEDILVSENMTNGDKYILKNINKNVKENDDDVYSMIDLSFAFILGGISGLLVKDYIPKIRLF